MTKESFERQYNVSVEQLDWKYGDNKLFMYAEVGPYCVYKDDAWGYYVTRGNSVCKWRTDLSRYLA